MAEPIGALRAEMSAGHAQFAADMKKAKDAVVSNAQGMEKGMNQAKRSFDASTKSLLDFRVKALAAATVSALLVRSVIKIADEYTLLDNKLKLVTKSAENLEAVQEGLYQQALRSHSSYAAFVDLYSRFARATETLGVSQAELLRITETINKAFIVSGATQEEASNATIQLSQGMASGVLRGEEFNSIMENGSRIAKMLADYLHTDVGGLRAMAKEGKITSEIMVKAFAASAGKIDEEFGKMQPTIQQAMTDLKTVFGRLVSDTNKGAEGTKSIAQEIARLAETIDQNRSGIIELFTQIISLATKATKAIGNIGQSLQGWAAVKSGRLSFFEFATMNAEELNGWLKKNNTEAAATKHIQDQIIAKKRKIVELEMAMSVPGSSSAYYQRQVDNLKGEISTLEKDLAKRQSAATAPSALLEGGKGTGKPAPGKKEEKKGRVAKGKSAGDVIASMQKELDLSGALTNEEKIRWEISKGEYKGFTARQKEKIILLAKEIDLLASGKLGTEAAEGMQKELDLIRATTEEEKVKWETEKGVYKDLAPAMKEKLVALAKQLDTTRALIEEEEKHKDNKQAIQADIDVMKEQAATFGMTATEIDLYRLKLQGATDEQLANAAATLEDIDLKRETKEILEDLRTPMDEYNATVETLNRLLAKGRITQEQYNKSLENAGKKLDDALNKNQDALKELQQSIEGWGRESADVLVDWALTGKNSFSDFADSVIKDILRMITYQMLLKPLFGGISGWAGGLLSFGGGRASGGPVSPGTMYEVNERGLPELLNIGNRQFLMMAGQSGNVTPTTDSGATGNSLSISVPVTVDGKNRMASELRNEIESAVERVIRRMS